MGRIVGRQRIREGRSLGERASEIVVYVVIAAALIWGGRWYFVVYSKSPKVAMARYLGLVKSGNVKEQFAMLSSASKTYFGTPSQYEDKWPPAQKLTGRVAGWEIGEIKESGDKAEVPVTLNVRKAGQELYQAASDPYTDDYVLVKEQQGWRIALEQSHITSVEAAKTARY